MLKHLLAKTVPFPRPERTVVGSSIALYCENVGAGPIWMADAKIDLETNRADLVIDKKAQFSDFSSNVSFKRCVGFRVGRHAFVDYPGFGIIKKSFEDAWPFQLRFR